MREALALGSEHLSSYEVIYEEDTALFDQLQAGQFDVEADQVAARSAGRDTQAGTRPPYDGHACS